MVLDHVDYRGAVTSVQVVGTNRHHFIFPDNSVYLGFIFYERLPVIFLQPERVARQPQPGKPPGLSLLQLTDPALKHPIIIERSPQQIPFLVWYYLYLPLVQIPAKILNCLPHHLLSLGYHKGLGGNPHAEFIILQTGFEIGDKYINQILLGLIKLAEVGTPGHAANHIDATISKFVSHQHPPCAALAIWLTGHILVLLQLSVNESKESVL